MVAINLQLDGAPNYNQDPNNAIYWLGEGVGTNDVSAIVTVTVGLAMEPIPFVLAIKTRRILVNHPPKLWLNVAGA